MRCFLNLIAILLFTCTVCASNVDELFKKANNYYKAGDYKAAIDTYEKILSDDMESATIYYNLGNAYYKSDSITKAILYYEKAKKLAPGDEHIAVNIAMANKKIQDRFETVPVFSLLGFLTSLTSLWPVDTWAIIAVVLFLLTLSGVIFYLITTAVRLKKIFFRMSILMMFLFVGTLSAAQLQYYEYNGQQYAIIIASAIDAESSPDEQGKKLYELHAGTKVKILTQLEDWVEVRLPDNNVAWIKATDIEII